MSSDTTPRHQIYDATNKYFHILPNMADDDLNPYEYRLYGHYKRVCGQYGQCWQSTPTTAQQTKMSVGQVVKTRRALAELGYISLDENAAKTLVVTISDIMPENVARYSKKRSPDERSPHEPKKNTLKDKDKEEPKDKNIMQPHLSESEDCEVVVSGNSQEGEQDEQPIKSHEATQLEGSCTCRRLPCICSQSNHHPTPTSAELEIASQIIDEAMQDDPNQSPNLTTDTDHRPVHDKMRLVDNMAVFEITHQLATLELTKPQRHTLIGWLLMQYENPDDFAPRGVSSKQIMNNLVKKGYLTTDADGHYSTRIQSTKPKSILFSLTYEDIGLWQIPEEKQKTAKPTDKPFWELVGTMICWNSNNMSWTKYRELASKGQWSALLGKIKDTCLALDVLHEDDPFTVSEMRWIIQHWIDTKFKGVPVTERRFPVSQSAIDKNFNDLRVAYKAHLETQE